MTKTFGFSQSDWDAAKREAHSEMVKAAQSATGRITYSDLATKIKAIRFEPDSHIFHELLGQISKAEDAEGRGMLSVVVVHKAGDKRGQPGDGFFKLARELDRSVRDPIKFWATELERVRTAWHVRP
jgi:hypothetical protein